MNFQTPTMPYWPNLAPDDISRISKFNPLVSSSVTETDNAAERAAMLTLISSLIKRNQVLERENHFLRTKWKVKKNSSNNRIADGVQKKGSNTKNSVKNFDNRFLKPCSYCQETHIYGHSRCKGYGATCNYCHRMNHLEVACTFKYPELRMFRKKNLNKVSSNKTIKRKDNCSRNSSRRVSPATSCSDLEVENLGNKYSLLKNVADKENETEAHECQSLVDAKLTKTSPNEIEVEPSETKVKEEIQMPKKDCKTAVGTQYTTMVASSDNDENTSNEGSGGEENKSREILKKKCRKSRRKNNKEKYETLVYEEKKTQEISNSRVTASKAPMEEYPGELNDLKYWLHCKDVLGLQNEKEYADIKMRIQAIEAKYKEKENSTSEGKKCKDIGK